MTAAISRAFRALTPASCPAFSDNDATAERGAQTLAVFQGQAHVFRQGFEAVEALRRRRLRRRSAQDSKSARKAPAAPFPGREIVNIFFGQGCAPESLLRRPVQRRVGFLRAFGQFRAFARSSRVRERRGEGAQAGAREVRICIGRIVEKILAPRRQKSISACLGRPSSGRMSLPPGAPRRREKSDRAPCRRGRRCRCRAPDETGAFPIGRRRDGRSPPPPRPWLCAWAKSRAYRAARAFS